MGFLGGVGVDVFLMGESVGRQLGRILNGVYKIDQPWVINEDPKQCLFIHKGRAEQLGVDISLFKFADYLYDWEKQLLDQRTVTLVIISFSITLCVIVIVLIGLILLVFQLAGKNVQWEKKEKLQRALADELPEKTRREFSKKVLESSRIDFEELALVNINGKVRRLGKSKENIEILLADWNGALVVYKQFGPMYRNNNSYFKQFKEELLTLYICKQAGAPNIVDIFGHVMEYSDPKKKVISELGIVMQYVTGGSLFDWILDNRDASWRVRLKLLLQVAMGMRFLHSKNIIHRDLKPQNILLSKKGRVKIIDFDFSKVSPGDEEVTKNIGTSCYKSPEVIAGFSDYDCKTDVFSFSMIMFQVLTSKADPFDSIRSLSRGSIDWKIAGENLRPLIPARIGRDDRKQKFVALMKSCWEHDSEKRPSFAILCSEFEKMIAEVSRGPPSPSPKPSNAKEKDRVEMELKEVPSSDEEDEYDDDDDDDDESCSSGKSLSEGESTSDSSSFAELHIGRTTTSEGESGSDEVESSSVVESDTSEGSSSFSEGETESCSE